MFHHTSITTLQQHLFWCNFYSKYEKLKLKGNILLQYSDFLEKKISKFQRF